MAIKTNPESEGPRSISGPGLSVARSAFNPVKIEAAVIVLSAVAVTALSERLVGGGGSFIVLLVYGVAAGAWIAVRSRQVLVRGATSTNTTPSATEAMPDGQE